MSSNKNRRARRGAAKRARATKTTALAKGFFLVDAQARHAANPRTFAVPFQAEIDAVRVGDYVKVLVKSAGDGGGERFWTWVVGRDGATFRGVVSNHLLLGDAMAWGSATRSGSRHGTSSTCIVNVCPPPCGSGKTHAVIHHSAEQVAAGERVAIISPTRRLVAQTAAGLMAAGCENVTAITGDTTPDPVAAVLRHVRDEARAPGVLLITHACHERLPYWHRPDRWHLIYDEAPAASWTETLNLPDTRDLLLPGLVVEPHSPDYLRVLPASGTHIRRIAANANGDDVYRLLQRHGEQDHLAALVGVLRPRAVRQPPRRSRRPPPTHLPRAARPQHHGGLPQRHAAGRRRR